MNYNKITFQNIKKEKVLIFNLIDNFRDMIFIFSAWRLVFKESSRFAVLKHIVTASAMDHTIGVKETDFISVLSSKTPTTHSSKAMNGTFEP